MNLHLSKKNDGSAMLVVAIIALIIAGILSGYLLLVSHESLMVQRSENWNSALNVAEAGVEEGMALININAGTANGGVTNWSSSATANGWDTTNQAALKVMTWSYNGTNQTWAATNGTIYHIRRWLDPNTGYYDVYVNNSSTNGPEILSIGDAKWAATGTSSMSDAVRKIYVQTYGSTTLGDNGLIGDQLNFNGNNVTIDSFDSSSPQYSIWHTNLWSHGANYGTWDSSLSYDTNSPPSRTANVHVASESGLVDVGNANIYGYINTTPGGSYTVKHNASVGDLNWVRSGTPGVESGHFKDDLNQTFTSPTLPTPVSTAQPNTNWIGPIAYTTIAQTQSVTIGGNVISWYWVQTGASHKTNIIRIGAVYSNGIVVGAGKLYTNIDNAGWVLPNGDGTTSTYKEIIPNRPDASSTNNIYYATNSLSGYVFVDSQFGVLYLTNGMSSPTLTINTNADLTIYSGGDISFGSTVNNTALARALTINDIKGDPINVSASGNASGVSKLFIPSSSITLNGGGDNTYDIIGEITCYSASFNGHFNLHFDESLVTNTPSSQFVSILWKEVQ
jgi:hypothetical protein